MRSVTRLARSLPEAIHKFSFRIEQFRTRFQFEHSEHILSYKTPLILGFWSWKKIHATMPTLPTFEEVQHPNIRAISTFPYTPEEKLNAKRFPHRLQWIKHRVLIHTERQRSMKSEKMIATTLAAIGSRKRLAWNDNSKEQNEGSRYRVISKGNVWREPSPHLLKTSEAPQNYHRTLTNHVLIKNMCGVVQCCMWHDTLQYLGSPPSYPKHNPWY